MIDIKPFLKNLISASGLSGFESTIREQIKEAWQPFSDELGLSRLGSLHALKRGNLPEPRPSILLAAHMDSIGLMVNAIIDGFLRVSEIGGIDHRVLPGQFVTIHGRKDLPGLIVQPSSYLLPPGDNSAPVPLNYLFVDTGLNPEEVNKLVRIGDLVSFAHPPLDIGKDELAGHSLDNRASLAALTYSIQELYQREINWDVWFVATVQEEETLGGALTSAFQLRPTLGIAIDVTFARSTGSPDHLTFPLGKGITLGWGPNIHPNFHKEIKEVADKFEIPYKLEAMPRHSGTDAMALQIAAEGIPTMVISIPLRYMHTPVEMVSIKDIQRTGRLITEFISQLDETFMEKISWENHA
jgi:tetrahedral aminopeptidase